MMHVRPGAVLLLAGLFLASAAGADEINEGELRFLEGRLDPPPHHHRKHLTIRPASIVSGWVEDRQCHENLDPVPALQIVFGRGRVRQLRITRAANIGSARVEGDSVQLTDVRKHAVLCLASENKLLEYDGVLRQYTLTSGPYMRRFLDGYFPMRVSFTLDYPPDRLQLVDLQPAALRTAAQRPPGQVRIDTQFEGRLEITLHFQAVTRP